MSEEKCKICGGNMDGHFHVDPVTFKIIYTAERPKPQPITNLVILGQENLRGY